MCEPAHSVCQFPHQNDHGMPLQSKMDALAGRIKGWCKRVGDWFHFSKLGNGHSETLEIGRQQRLWLPPETRWEGLWYRDRGFVWDGGPNRSKEAQEAARYYSDNVLYESLSKFRRFLEISMVKSDKPNVYFHCFMNGVMTADGRDAVYRRFREVYNISNSNEINTVFRKRRQNAIKTFLGFVRKSKRNLFVPVYADDDHLWS